MARKPRIECSGALYHVISRGNQQQNIFLDETDYRRYLDLLASYRKRYAFTLYAYVLMSNHVHLLIEQGKTPLSKVMQGLGQSYTGYYNRKYKKSGHLFQGRYKAILCERDAYLLELVRYIHLNPVRAGMVNLPDEYPWSSHHAYLSDVSGGLVEVDLPLSLVAPQRKAAVTMYKSFMADGLSLGHREDFYKVKEQRFLGTDDFVTTLEGMQQAFEERLFPVALTLDDVVGAVAEAYGIPSERITDKSRAREGARLRAMVACLAKDVGGILMHETARYFDRDLSTLSIVVKKLREQVHMDKAMGERLYEIEKNLRRGRRAKYQINKV